jgi:sterol desaturase/sphingolipid hydroxylase (fatty acid hydroxylase superfamily)
MSPSAAQRALSVPPERQGSVVFGVLAHLGPAAIVVAGVARYGFDLSSLGVSFVAASLFGLVVLLAAERRSPSVPLHPASSREVLEGMSLVFAKGVGVGTAVVVAGWFLGARLLPLPWHTSGWGPVALAVPLTDLGYYGVHRGLNHSRGDHPVLRWYRRNHAMHHAVSALDFLRGNVSSLFDTAITGFQIPLVILAAVLRMDLHSTLVAYALVLLLQGTHHVNHTFNIGALRYVFVDNHAHKLHHCPRGTLVNHGALFSLWDRMFGTFYEDWSRCPSFMAKHGIALPIRVGSRRASAVRRRRGGGGSRPKVSRGPQAPHEQSLNLGS